MPRLTAERLRSLGGRVVRAEGTTGFLVRGSAVSLATRVAGVLLSYGATVLLSRSLGVERFGVYSLALSWALVLVIAARFGLDNAALRFVAIYLQEGRAASSAGFMRFALILVFALSVMIGAVLYVLTALGLTTLSPALVLPTALLIFPIAALGLNAALLRTAQRIFAAQFYDQILRPAVLAMLIVAAAGLGARLSSARAMTLTSAGAWVALIFSAIHVQRALSHRTGQRDYGLWRGWIGFSAPLLVMAIVQELLNQINIIMLGYLDGAAGAGLYSVAWRLGSLVTFGLTAIVSMTGPMIAAAHAKSDLREVAHIARVSAQFGFASALCLVIPLAIAGRALLGVFGPGFTHAYPALLLMLMAGLGSAFTGTVGYLMVMTDRHLQALAIFTGALLLNIALNAMLIPRMSVVGAAAAATAATLFWNFAMLVYIRRRIGVDASALGLKPRNVASS